MTHMNAQIVRLYDTVFDRAPDAGGLEFWNNASHTGFGLRDLATFFISAPEFASTYGEPTNRGFVESMYLNVLDRPGEAEGVAFWTNALDAGLADRPQIVVGFSESAEHVQQMAQPPKTPLEAMSPPEALPPPPPYPSSPKPPSSAFLWRLQGYPSGHRPPHPHGALSDRYRGGRQLVRHAWPRCHLGWGWQRHYRRRCRQRHDQRRTRAG